MPGQAARRWQLCEDQNPGTGLKGFETMSKCIDASHDIWIVEDLVGGLIPARIRQQHELPDSLRCLPTVEFINPGDWRLRTLSEVNRGDAQITDDQQRQT